jgi:RimJ/RimL family protein N-acetyltransferase
MEYVMVFGIMIVVIGFISWRWVVGIDYMQKNHPDYTGDDLFGIFDKESDQHIGNIKLGPINWFHRYAEIGLIIGNKDFWGKGVATDSITLISLYAFNTLNLHKVTAGCYASNIGSKKAFLKAGFDVDGVRKSHCFSQGKWEDLILLGKINE